jgi:protein tyrosine/serine phosphatase
MAEWIDRLLLLGRVGLRLLGVIAGLAAVWFGHRYAIGNVHTVEPGVLYRSGTLSGHTLQSLIDDKGIRTIINLRGANPGKVWYDTKVAIAAAANVAYINVRMSAHRVPSDETIQSLVSAMATAQRPVLIHCEAGADRSSFASAVFAYLELGRPLAEARRQMTLYYGHETWTDWRKAAMGRAFEVVVQRFAPGRAPEAARSTDRRQIADLDALSVPSNR